MIPETAVRQLKSSLRGPTFSPGDLGYDEARTVPNAMVDKRPAIIARCASAADVITCVRFAREQDMVVAVRGGGHSVAGKSVCEAGLMIDLSAMKGIRVDPLKKTVRAEAGLKLGEFDRETQAFGLATTLGVVPDTGISGLTLGGGFGNLMAMYGLALDNVIGVDVVTADGRLLSANDSENSDLFWGVRGSSGNLGIATSLEYRLHEVGPVLGGAVFYPLSKTKEVLLFCREFAETLPDEVVLQGAGLNLPDGTPVLLSSSTRPQAGQVIAAAPERACERARDVEAVEGNHGARVRPEPEDLARALVRHREDPVTVSELDPFRGEGEPAPGHSGRAFPWSARPSGCLLQRMERGGMRL